MIVCTCGHKVDSYDDAFVGTIKGYSRDNVPAVMTGTYCRSCYNRFREEGDLLESQEEIMAWLNEVEQ